MIDLYTSLLHARKELALPRRKLGASNVLMSVSEKE